MVRFLKQIQPLWLLLLGAIVGYAAARLGSVPLLATSTDRTENITIATGFIDDGIEGIVSLDHLTGELNVMVPSLQGPFVHRYSYQTVNTDLRLEANKTPKYSMVTGQMRFQTAGGAQWSSLAIYVAEETSGNIAAYRVPWTRAMVTATRPTQGQIALFDVKPAGSSVRR
jgi:hypothetical protein